MSTMSITPNMRLVPGYVPEQDREACAPRSAPDQARPVGNVGSAPQRGPGRAAVRLTRRGRVTVLLVFLAAIAAAMVALGPIATATFQAGSPEPVRIVQVGPGDTLYGLAAGVARPGHIQDMVAHIEQLNALDGPELQVGQQLAIPVR